MKSVSKKRANVPGEINQQAARRLLSPTLNFLVASGLDYAGARDALEAAWIKASKSHSQVKISTVSSAEAYRKIVSTWTTNFEYLDTEGYPQVLPIQGKRSFTALVREVNKDLSVPVVIDELRGLGNLRRMPGQRLKLLKKFFHVSSDSAMAFEPHFEFLEHASVTVSSLLSRHKKKGADAENFWRTVEEIDLPEEHFDAYLAFIRHRSLLFLQEIDEWLRAHSPKRRGASPRVRAGLGLFTYGRRRL